MEDVVFAFVFSLLLPPTMIVLGAVWMVRPPRNRFGMCGFKTERARASAEAWEFAHHHIGRIFVPFGIVLFVASLAVVWLVPGNKFVQLNWITLVQFFVILTIAGETQFALCRHFDAFGHPLKQ